MCKGSYGVFTCPKKDTCYRYTASPNSHWQSYFMSVPYDEKNETCEHYWSDEKVKPVMDEDDKIAAYKKYKK